MISEKQLLRHPQVLIVGAGPTGLAVACQLLRLGIEIRLIDKKAGPSLTSQSNRFAVPRLGAARLHGRVGRIYQQERHAYDRQHTRNRSA